MDFFNIESCESTEELESSLKNQMIGSTMYDKRWVLNLVFHIGSNKDLDINEFYSDLTSLSEMSVDTDVSEYLFVSGSLEILWSQINNYEDVHIKELISLILVNCGSNDKIISQLVSMDQYFMVPFYLVESDSAPLLINIFRYLRLLVNKLLILVDGNDESNPNNRISDMEQILSEDIFQQQLCFIYSSSTNNQLLLRSGVFLLSLTELFCEISREDSLEGIFSHKNFIFSFYEALKQSVSKKNQDTTFVYIELIGHYINSENVETIAQELCSTLYEVLQNYAHDDIHVLSTDDLDMLGTLLKICATCWNHIAHEESYSSLLKLSKELDAFSCDKHVALKENIRKCLNTFAYKFSCPL
ncbi:uncharacterized protein [Lepeophtheirus salmonis]|uniref:uncharacterized protein n=1 Tax=Lepeophtheirus salmonis TaxID=72036 RepID=UPI003AF34C18